MDEKQQEFISWLSNKLQAQDEQDLQNKLKDLGEDGIRQAYDQFLTEDQNAEAPVRKEGGKLDYLKCLKQYKKGGKLGCGCGGMKLNLKKKEGGKLEDSFKGTKAVKGLNPKIVKMGQGVDGVLGSQPVKKRQQGGLMQKNAAPNMMQQTPEQIQDQKVDAKANEMMLKANPQIAEQQEAQRPKTLLDLLKGRMDAQKTKLKPKKMMELLSSNGQTFGIKADKA